jgi:hypothetical protein
MEEGVTAQLLFDGTFSIDAVSATAHAVVQRLHDEAMATIAHLADHWRQPVEAAPPAPVDEPVTYTDPASWSVEDDEDGYAEDGYAEDGYGDDEDDDVRVLPMPALPSLLPRPRRTAANVTAQVEPSPAADALAGAATDEFAVPATDDRQFVAV